MVRRGMAIKPGLQLIDLLLQLGYVIQRLAQGILQNQDISLNFGGSFPQVSGAIGLGSTRPWIHRFSQKNYLLVQFFSKISK